MPKSIPKVAIVTRTKNRPEFLARAIKSVLSQSYKDFVHVILNDGGDRDVVENILSKHPDERRVVVHNTTSAGLVKALNQAVKATESEFVAILDDDDAWHSGRLKASMKSIEANPEQKANVVKMDIVVESFENGKIIEKSRQLHPESGEGEISLFKQCIRNYLSNGVVMYRRSVYDELGGYDESLATAEDWDFGVRLMKKYDVEFVDTDKAMVYYHQRPDDKSATGNSVLAGVKTQEKTINKIRNKYLREDLEKGKIGPGYIMNQAVLDIQHVVRLEGHVNRSVEHIGPAPAPNRRSIIQRIISKMRRG